MEGKWVIFNDAMLVIGALKTLDFVLFTLLYCISNSIWLGCLGKICWVAMEELKKKKNPLSFVS